jgi:tetratricopeptide (TPR) repeat protein
LNDLQIIENLPISHFQNPIKKTIFAPTNFLRNMATYKKRGAKPRDKREQANLESQSATAEVFKTLDQTANKSEQWIEKNKNILFYGLVTVVVVILGYMGYNKFMVEPTEIEASNELAFPRKYFDEAATAPSSEVDSILRLGLDGADANYGFVNIAEKYSGTKAGNLANYYAGVSYLKLKEYKKAISYLEKFSSDDDILGPTAIGAIGDAFADLDQSSEALTYYEKAANAKTNNFTTPLFLQKAGKTAMELGQFAKAEQLFQRIKDEFSTTDFGRGIDKYISSAKYAQQ